MKISSESNASPFAYFITIRTYATWMHGDERGSIDRKHNGFKQSMRRPCQTLHRAMKSIAQETAFLLNEEMRATVLRNTDGIVL